MPPQETPLWRRFIIPIIAIAVLSIPLFAAMGRKIRCAVSPSSVPGQINNENLSQYRRVAVFSETYNPVPIARDEGDVERFDMLAMNLSQGMSDGLMRDTSTVNREKLDALISSGRFFMVEQNTPAAVIQQGPNSDYLLIEILSGPQQGKRGWIIPQRAKEALTDLR